MDHILAGRATSDEYADIASFFRELRLELEEAPPSWVESRHLGGIFAEAGRVQPAAAAPQTVPPSHPRLHNPFRRLAARATITAAGLAALATFGGVAYAGALPAPLQTKVAEIARHVGLTLPVKHHHTKQHTIHVPSTRTSITPNGADHSTISGGQDETPTTGTGSVKRSPATGNEPSSETARNDQSSGTADGSQDNNHDTTPEQTQSNDSNTTPNSDTTEAGTDSGQPRSNQDRQTTTDQSGAPQQPQPQAPTDESLPSNDGGDSGTGSTQQINDGGNGN